MDVPVNPVWPNERGEKRLPADEFSLGVSQPRARLDPGTPAFCVNFSTVSRETMRRCSSTPPSSSIWAKRARSGAVENRPACGATPPSA